MVTKRKSSRRSDERGSTLYGALAGLLIGLIIAAIVAFYVTKTPMPFVDRASRQNDQGKLPDLSQAPDPNSGLFGRDGAAGTPPAGPTATTPTPLPGANNGGAPPPGKSDDLGALIATLPSTNGSAAVATPSPVASIKPSASAIKPATSTLATPKPPAAAGTGTYYLQAGAFRGPTEAESLKARILLLGLPVMVQRADVDGKPINRVRVGPFARLDDMNRARSRLGESKIESAVVRQ